MNKKFFVGILILVLLAFIAGCDQLSCPPGCTQVQKETGTQTNISEITGGVVIPPIGQKNQTGQSSASGEQKADITVVEGELVKLNPKATDPEGDDLIFIFSAPLNEKGEWQTEIGDAGTYTTKVRVSDGINEVSKDVTILVKSKNRPPVMQPIAGIAVNEGETVTINPVVSDPDGDTVKLSYSGWMNKSSYTTNYNDQGEHIVKVTASDGKTSVSQDVKITVKNFNRAPVLEKISDIVTKEDDVVIVNVKASDLDNDKLTITYSEPLSDEGTWVTEIGDAGIYAAKVTVSDGQAEASQDFKIIVEKLNLPPTIEKINDITVNEGGTVTINPVVSDPEGDTVKLSYSGWMTSNSYKTNFNDQGEHIVTVTASDGINEVSQNVKVIVGNVNNPPVFTGI